MVPKNEEKVSKKRKNKSKNVIELNDEVTSVKCSELSQVKTVKDKSKKKCGSTESDINFIDKSAKAVPDNYNNETTSDSQYQNDNEKSIEILNNENKFDNRETNSSLLPIGHRRPSLSGSTKSRVVYSNRKFMRKIYQRKLKWSKNLIEILISASGKDSFLDNIIKNTMEFSEDKYNKKEDRNGNENNVISSNNEGRLTHIPEIPINDIQKSIELGGKSTPKVDGRISETDYFSRPSTSKAFENRNETPDDKSSGILTRLKENFGADNSKETISGETFDNNEDCKKLCQKSGHEKLAEKVDHNSDDVIIHSHQEPKKFIEGMQILKTTSKTVAASEDLTARSNSAKKDHKVRTESKELLEDANHSSTEDESDQLSPVIGGIKSCSREMRKKLIRKINQIANSKREKKSGVSINPGIEEIRNKDTKNESKIAWNKESKKKFTPDNKSRNADELELKNKQKKGGSYCSCKRKKIHDVKFSGYKIPAGIEYPRLKICEGHRKCSNGMKAIERNIISSDGKAKVSSYIGEKETNKFYSSLELEYSEMAKSKWDSKYAVEFPEDRININNEFSNGTPEVSSQRMNDKVTLSMKKCSEKSVSKRVSKPCKKFAISNFTLSPNRSRNDDYLDAKLSNSNNSNSSKIPTFSKYSIPVSIEINISTNHNLARRNFDMDLVQSKITQYFPSYTVKNDSNKIENNQNYSISASNDIMNNPDENCYNISNMDKRQKVKSSIMKNHSEPTTSRSLPKIESDILLKNSEKVIYRKKNYTLRKPKLSISRKDYLYSVLSDGNKSLKPVYTSLSASLTNQNCVTYERDIFQSINNNNSEKRKFQSCNTDDKTIIEDSNNSIEDCSSIVPTSYSIFSDGYDDDNNNNNNDNNKKCIIDIEQILDTQQKQEMLAPWENVDIIEKINRWNENITFD